ncbi:MAG: hypothetical protein ABJQ29_11555 [Luteolibacter sp.]
MKINLSFSLPALGCLALASCYPIDHDPRGPRGPNDKPDKTVTSQDQQKIQEQRDRMKEKDEKKKEVTDAPKEKPKDTTTTTDKPAQKKGDYAFANPVPGKEGFVFSPYNNKLVDVRDIPSGTLVQDPTYPASEKKYFRVP